MLFFALQVVQQAEAAAAATKWAAEVLRFSGGSTEPDVWPPPGAAEWQGRGSRAAPLYERLDTAYKVLWYKPELEAICLAIQAWSGAGQWDGLEPHHLYSHMAKPRPGPKLPSCKGTPPVRYKSIAILKVARLVRDDGAQLRRLLKMDVPREELPTARETAELLQSQLEQKEAELKAEKEKRLKAEAAGRMARLRRAEQVKRMREHRQEMSLQVAERVKAYKAKVKAESDLKAAEKLDLENERLAVQYEEALEQEKAKTAKARARARDKESDAQSSQKRLKRAQRAEAELKRVRQQLEALQGEEGSATDSDDDDEVHTSKRSRRDSGGRFQAESWRLRWLKWSQISRRVPTSAINANITEVLSVYAPQELTPQQTERSIRAMRVEATIAGEALNAWRFAKARRVISFGEDESTKWGKAIITTNTQIEPHDAPGTSVDIVLRGATLTAGGTSEALAKHLETKHLAHGRGLLECWRATHEKRWGVGAWERDSGAEPQQVGLHRLSENTLLMSDTCHGARKLKQLLANMAEAAGRAKLGEEVWATMSEAERGAKVKSHLGDCNGHLRNIIIKAMTGAATEHLQGELEDDLAEFSSFDRVTVEVGDLIYRVYKELHPSGQYAKGKGPECEAWRKKFHASKMWLPFEHAGNARQDIAFDGAVPLFINRKLILEFLHSLNVPGASNRLEECLRTLFRSNEMTALLRVCTLFQLIFSAPMRWLAGKHEQLQDFSIVSCSRMLELAEVMFKAVAADGHALLDPALDPFKEIADQQPLFREWRAAREARVTRSPDGTPYAIHKVALAEARSPAGAGNAQATEMVVALAEKMANGALAAMHDSKRAIADKLTSQAPAILAILIPDII